MVRAWQTIERNAEKPNDGDGTRVSDTGKLVVALAYSEVAGFRHVENLNRTAKTSGMVINSRKYVNWAERLGKAWNEKGCRRMEQDGKGRKGHRTRKNQNTPQIYYVNGRCFRYRI